MAAGGLWAWSHLGSSTMAPAEHANCQVGDMDGKENPDGMQVT
jgi:hypothetical protein